MFDLKSHIERMIAFSAKTFGPGPRTKGVIKHIKKELKEIERKPTDIEEWIDVIILGIDGAWRAGATADDIIRILLAKQEKNENRTWPDWRFVPEGEPIEHDRSKDT